MLLLLPVVVVVVIVVVLLEDSRIQIPAQPLSRVTLGKLLNPSVLVLFV